jgi:hypothetical protein
MQVEVDTLKALRSLEGARKGRKQFEPSRRLHPVVKLLLLGTREKASPLSALRHGLSKTVLRKIWQMVCADMRGAICLETHEVVFAHCVLSNASWPQPRPEGINVNMLPFIVGQKSSLPTLLHGYWQLIQQLPISHRNNTTAYLTVQEGSVQAGCTQRTPGLHTESAVEIEKDQGGAGSVESYQSWGGGESFYHNLAGGIFMGSTVSGTCRLVHCSVGATHVGRHGNLEHMRPWIEDSKPKRSVLKANEIWWITDKTPHEALPLMINSERQFFRLIAADIDIWYSAHNTANPMVEPACRVVDGSKFV